MGFFVGVSAPRGVPAEISARVYKAVQEAMEDRALRESLESTGLTFLRLPSGEYRGYIQREIQRWRELVNAAGIVAQ